MPVEHPSAAESQPPAALGDKEAGSEDAPAVLVEELGFTYPEGVTALRNASLRVDRGEKVALVGPNGAGKSTLLLHLNGTLVTQSGQVLIDGLPVRPQNLPAIRGKVGMVFEDPDDQLFSPTVFEDVAFGPLHLGLGEAEVRARVRRALEQVEMAEHADRLSHHLSLGEKKRVALATVLSMDPQLLVLDEPSSGLDPRGRRGLIDLLRSFSLTILVATHDMRMVGDLFPRTVIIDEGQIVADGDTQDLMADASLLKSHGLEPP